MAKYRVVTTYSDGTMRTLETKDGKKAMQEAANCSYQEDTAKVVSLEMDGQSIWQEKVKAYESGAIAG